MHANIGSILLFLVCGCAGERKPEAVEQCRQAWTRMAGVKLLVEACAGLYTRSPCRDALLAAANGKGSPDRAMLGACRDAYCKDLRAPLPKACSVDIYSTPDDPWRAAGELDAAILAGELGLDRAQAARVSLFRETFSAAAVKVQLPRGASREAARPSTVIELVSDGDGLHLSCNSREARLPLIPSNDEADAAIAAMALSASPDETIVLEVAAEVPQVSGQNLFRALTRTGRRRVALATHAPLK